MIEEYVPSDTHRDNFYERFMERRVQQLNNPKETAKDDLIPFPIVALFSAPTVLPTKRISNTSDDSGINSSPTLSPTIPPQSIDHWPRTPINNPSSSLTITSPIPPSQPLTPIQRLIHHKTRKYQNKEPKYNQSQPDYPDAESVLRTQKRQGYKL